MSNQEREALNVARLRAILTQLTAWHARKGLPRKWVALLQELSEAIVHEWPYERLAQAESKVRYTEARAKDWEERARRAETYVQQLEALLHLHENT